MYVSNCTYSIALPSEYAFLTLKNRLYGFVYIYLYKSFPKIIKLDRSIVWTKIGTFGSTSKTQGFNLAHNTSNQGVRLEAT